MKVKELIKTLKQFDKNDEVQIYILENGGDLVHANIESILDTEIGCELTVEKEYDDWDLAEKWTQEDMQENPDKYESVKPDNEDYFVQEEKNEKTHEKI